MEIGNVVVLYYFPDSRFANGMGIFKAWEESKADPEVHDLVKYLVNWVAGSKLIFVLLLGVLLFIAADDTLILAGGALILAISSFFWRLYPQIRDMDARDQIEPKNYSRILWWMILSMILVILFAILVVVII